MFNNHPAESEDLMLGPNPSNSVLCKSPVLIVPHWESYIQGLNYDIHIHHTGQEHVENEPLLTNINKSIQDFHTHIPYLP